MTKSVASFFRRFRMATTDVEDAFDDVDRMLNGLFLKSFIVAAAVDVDDLERFEVNEGDVVIPR